MTQSRPSHSARAKETPVVEARGLHKRFGAFNAVNGLDLTIERGEMYGFLGPNGAGKTTSLRMLLGLLTPSAGAARLFGEPVGHDSFALKRRIGIAFEQQSFYEEMTAWEYLLFFGRLYAVENAEARTHALLERLNLLRFRDVLISSYSTGMQRKLSLARALLHSPELLVLDEPVSGLDPYGIKQFREILLEERAAGVTILISSHILSEIERTADRVGILARGRLIAEDTMESLRRRVRATRRLEIELAEHAAAIAPALRTMDGVKAARAEGNQLFVETLVEPDQRAAVSRAITGMGGVILEMRTAELSLEETFIQLTESYIEQLAMPSSDDLPEESHA